MLWWGRAGGLGLPDVILPSPGAGKERQMNLLKLHYWRQLSREYSGSVTSFADRIRDCSSVLAVIERLGGAGWQPAAIRCCQSGQPVLPSQQMNRPPMATTTLSLRRRSSRAYLPYLQQPGDLDPPPRYDVVTERMRALLNDERVAAGCAPVTVNDELLRAAQTHTKDMADHGFVDHRGTDGTMPHDACCARAMSTRM